MMQAVLNNMLRLSLLGFKLLWKVLNRVWD